MSISKEELRKLVSEKSEIIRLKKAATKFTDALTINELPQGTTKALQTNNEDNLEAGVIKRTIVGNTYYWMDSHGDVHLENVFAKSISENAKLIPHLHDHKFSLEAKVGKPTLIQEKDVAWQDLGVNEFGMTQALFMDTEIKRELNPTIYSQYLDKEIQQHSVGMLYVQIDLAINDPEFKEEYALWQSVIGKLGNKEAAEAKGFFWAIKEAKLIEVSAVIRGSNVLTPTVPNAEKTLQDKEEIKEEITCLMHEAPNEDYKQKLKALLDKTLEKSLADSITLEEEPLEDKKKSFLLGYLNLKPKN